MLFCHLNIFFDEVFIKVFGIVFNWVFYFLMVEFEESCVYFGYQFFISYIFCKYFLHVCGLMSNSLDLIFHRAEAN